MLAALRRELPVGPYVYEPKWDGFRCVAFVDREVELQSRHGKSLTRYFPELVDALARLESAVVLDGEMVVHTHEGPDFGALMNRTHPAASRVARLAIETPATFIAFDLLAIDDEDLTDRPFAERRAQLEALLRDERSNTISITPSTDDVSTAEQWLDHAGRGIDGVVAKHRELRYAAGKRAMIKVKRERTLECVVGGMRLFEDHAVASLLLGLWDDDVLRHVGVSSSFTEARRRALFEKLRASIMPLTGHPWEDGFHIGASPVGRLPGSAGRWTPGEMALDWVPLRPEHVAEVAYDHLDGQRLRHPARFVRWRPDRDPRSCTFEQLP